MRGLGSHAFAVLALSLLASTVAAQDGAPQSVPTTAVIITEGGAELADSTRVYMGVRRGARSVERVRFIHTGDRLSDRSTPPEIFDAEEQLNALADRVRISEGPQVADDLDAILALFEENLPFVSRSLLVDAYMLRAIAACQSRRGQADCVRYFEHVVSFRESALYDVERYPPDQLALFEETKGRMVDEGLRGSIEIHTLPEGAEVFVDGRSYGPSPTVAEGLLVGDHYVTVKAVGYEEVVRRVTVNESYQESVDIELLETARSLQLTQAIPAIRGQLGEQRAGDALRQLESFLTVKQVIFAVVRPVSDGELSVSLYVYDLVTRFKQAEATLTVPRGDEGSDVIEQATRALYEEVDLSGQIEAPDETVDGDEFNLFTEWWFYVAVGVVVASAITIPLVLAGQEASCEPNGLCVSGMIDIQ